MIVKMHKMLPTFSSLADDKRPAPKARNLSSCKHIPFSTVKT